MNAEIFDGILRENLRGFSTWQLVADQQKAIEEAEDWLVIDSLGGDVPMELSLAKRTVTLIGMELQRRSAFGADKAAQARQVELTALKERCVGQDFVDVVGHYVEVSVAGREWKFRCRIHGNDSDPSGLIHAQEGRWWCFGCGRGGDVFDFLMVYGRLAFGEAAALLGRLYGLKMGRGNGG
jgi:hypothetical protein